MNRLNEKGTRATTRAVLSLKETLALQKLVLDAYSGSGLDDVRFAESINAKNEVDKWFRFPLNRGHIASMREALGIKNNVRPSSSDEDCVSLTLRVQALEDQLSKLTAWLRKDLGYK